MIIEQNKDLRPLTTFGIAARARWFTRYSSLDALKKIMRTEIWQRAERLHIGAGSNLLFISDFDGLVLKSDIFGRTLYRKDADTVFAIAGAAENWSDFVDWCVEQKLAGLENLAYIPGEVGSSAVQNVGAYGVEAGDLIHAVEALDTLTGEVKRIAGRECGFAYRHSHFKDKWRGRYIILRVSFRLRPSTAAANLDYGPLRELARTLGHAPTIAQVRDAVTAIRREKLPDPAVLGNAGSFFKNPVIRRKYYEAVVRPLAPDMPVYPADEEHVKLSAGWLIEHAGLKGAREGGAEVYPRQCLVIINRDNATADDVVRLADQVGREVKRRFFVELHPEVNYIDTTVRAEILGSGTSKGVPEAACTCDTCTSTDSRDKRLRASVWVRTHGLSLLIDPSPDFREQALRAGIMHIDAVIITHIHYDHIGGIEDLRPFCLQDRMPVYATADVAENLRSRLGYCFKEHPYPGVPQFSLHTITPGTPFTIKGLKILPVEVLHGRMPITGFRIGGFGYITDASEIPADTITEMQGLEVLVLNALRHTPHFAHFTVEQALAEVERMRPAHTYLTHICHDLGRHADQNPLLPSGVSLAYDGLTITCGLSGNWKNEPEPTPKGGSIDIEL